MVSSWTPKTSDSRQSGGACIGAVDIQLRHQEHVEQAIAVVLLKHDDRATRRRLGYEIRMGDIESAAICHPNRERAEGLKMQRRSELFGGHKQIIASSSLAFQFATAAENVLSRSERRHWYPHFLTPAPLYYPPCPSPLAKKATPSAARPSPISSRRRS